MKMFFSILFFSLVCGISAQAQAKVEYGDLEALIGVKKIYIDVRNDMDLHDEIGAEIRKSLPDLKFAGRPEEANIHLRYSQPSNLRKSGPLPPQAMRVPEGMVVKIINEDNFRVLMNFKAQGQSGVKIVPFGKKARPDLEFAREFVKAYQKANAPEQALDGQKSVLLERLWNGEISIELRSQAPEGGYIVSQQEWEKLWKAYRGNAPVPEVDFTKELVLVGVNKDPNNIGVQAKLDDKGDLKVTYTTTLMFIQDPKTCKYQMGVIKREGVKTINGDPIKGS
jgi:hypothetical protein